MRSDTLKKQELSKREAEDKVAYLLKQLRSAETKISRLETLAARGESKQRESFSSTFTASDLISNNEGSVPLIRSTSTGSGITPSVIARFGDKALASSIHTSSSRTYSDVPAPITALLEPDDHSSNPSPTLSPRNLTPSPVGPRMMLRPVSAHNLLPDPVDNTPGVRTSLTNKYALFVNSSKPGEGDSSEVQDEVVKRWATEKDKKDKNEKSDKKDEHLLRELNLLKNQMKSPAP